MGLYRAEMLLEDATDVSVPDYPMLRLEARTISDRTHYYSVCGVDDRNGASQYSSFASAPGVRPIPESVDHFGSSAPWLTQPCRRLRTLPQAISPIQTQPPPPKHSILLSVLVVLARLRHLLGIGGDPAVAPFRWNG